MNTELLTQITTLTSDLNTHFERAWQAAMNGENGQPDELEKKYQIDLAIVELHKLNQLVFPASTGGDMVISEVLKEQRAEINELRSIFDLNEMD
jgi:hypothetical protein